MDILTHWLMESGIEEGTAAEIAAQVDDCAALDGCLIEISPRAMASVLARLGWRRRRSHGRTMFYRNGAPWINTPAPDRPEKDVREYTQDRRDKVASIVRKWDAQTHVTSGSPSTLADSIQAWYCGNMRSGLGGQSVARVLIEQCGWIKIGRYLHKRQEYGD